MKATMWVEKVSYIECPCGHVECMGEYSGPWGSLKWACKKCGKTFEVEDLTCKSSP